MTRHRELVERADLARVVLVTAALLLAISAVAWAVTDAMTPPPPLVAPTSQPTTTTTAERGALIPPAVIENTTTTPAPTTTTTEAAVETTTIRPAGAEQARDPNAWPWADLADCESGDWDRHRNPIPGSRRWDDRRNGYEGGLHFAPGTWDAYKLPGSPDSAADAPPQLQVDVAIRVRDGATDDDPSLTAQGWGAWPVCSRKIGAR